MAAKEEDVGAVAAAIAAENERFEAELCRQEAPAEAPAEVEVEEWQQQVEALKGKGVTAYKNGLHEAAAEYFTQALALDPENHVLYGNRSLAWYAFGDAKSKAFQDAVKATELRPDWPKGWSRKGAAELALGRFEEAQTSYRTGLRLDPGNPALQSGFEKAREAEELARERRLATARAQRDLVARREREVAEAKAQDEALKTDDDRLLDFFSVIDDTEAQRKSGPRPGAPAAAGGTEPADPEDKEAAAAAKPLFHEKYKEQNKHLGTPRELIDFILAPHYKWRNLNPYFVLKLDVDATDEDIRLRYKRMSLRIHPDKNRDIEEEAREAFEQLKAAYQLLFEKTEAGDLLEREIIINRIERSRKEASKRHRLLLSKGLTETAGLEPLEQMQRKEVMKAFAEAERNREEAIRLRRAHEAREKEQEQVQLLEMRSQRDFNRAWSKKERQEARVGDWREFAAEEPEVAAQQAKLWKAEVRGDKKRKYGQVDLEEWKKDWK